MKLIKASAFIKRYFHEDEKLDLRTVRSWVEKGEVAGRIVGLNTYVDVEAWEASTGNKIADRILKAA